MNATTTPERAALQVTTETDRSKRLGGSDIAAILGVSPWRTAAQLWLDKVRPETREQSDTPATRRGSRLEPYIIDWAREEYGLRVRDQRGQRYVDPIVPYFAAEIDFEIDADDGEIENGEVKTVHPFGGNAWGEQMTDDLPVYYTAQVQFGMGVTGRRRCHVIALIGDELRRYVVERDDEIINAMRQRAQTFWEAYVLPRVQPPLDFDHASAIDTLKRLYPGTNGQTLPATGSQTHWREVFKEAARMKKHYEAAQDAAKAHLLAAMGEAAALDFGDGEVFRRKEIKRKETTIVQPAISYMDARFAKAPGARATNANEEITA